MHPHVSILACPHAVLSAGVLAGAIDYYILSRWQRLQDKNVFTKVRQASLSARGICLHSPAGRERICGGHAADHHRRAAINCLHIFLQDDFKLGKKLATGGFGTVYRAALDDGSREGRQVIVKKARQQTGSLLDTTVQAALCYSSAN